MLMVWILRMNVSDELQVGPVFLGLGSIYMGDHNMVWGISRMLALIQLPRNTSIQENKGLCSANHRRLCSAPSSDTYAGVGGCVWHESMRHGLRVGCLPPMKEQNLQLAPIVKSVM